MAQKKLDGVQFVDGILHLWLAPALLGNVNDGVHIQLESFLLKYIRKLDGVVLAFSNVKILETGGNIYNDQPQVLFFFSFLFFLLSSSFFFSKKKTKGNVCNFFSFLFLILLPSPSSLLFSFSLSFSLFSFSSISLSLSLSLFLFFSSFSLPQHRLLFVFELDSWFLELNLDKP